SSRRTWAPAAPPGRRRATPGGPSRPGSTRCARPPPPPPRRTGTLRRSAEPLPPPPGAAPARPRTSCPRCRSRGSPRHPPGPAGYRPPARCPGARRGSPAARGPGRSAPSRCARAAPPAGARRPAAPPPPGRRSGARFRRRTRRRPGPGLTRPGRPPRAPAAAPRSPEGWGWRYPAWWTGPGCEDQPCWPTLPWGTMSYSTSPAWGAGLATVSHDQVLDVWYPAGALGLGTATAEEVAAAADAGLPALAGPRALPDVRTEVVEVSIGSLADPPKDTADAYLRLHLLSHRMVQPHQANLDGLFGLLPTVAWTSAGPCPVDRVGELQLRERAAGRHLAVYGVDKFPRMTDYVIPSGVRIADADRVRLGAHLAAGTTVMHEGFVNFNAGTLGASMDRQSVV